MISSRTHVRQFKHRVGVKARMIPVWLTEYKPTVAPGLTPKCSKPEPMCVRVSATYRHCPLSFNLHMLKQCKFPVCMNLCVCHPCVWPSLSFVVCGPCPQIWHLKVISLSAEMHVRLTLLYRWTCCLPQDDAEQCALVCHTVS